MFVKPGLTEEEARGTIFLYLYRSLLFLLGVFQLFILFPMVLHFMSTINQSIGVQETYGISQYFTFMFNIVIPVSLIFEMPVVVLFLTKLGILDPFKLKKARKISYFLLIVIGISLTPPDIVSDLLIIVPLILLYEVSVLISGWAFKKRIRGELDAG